MATLEGTGETSPPCRASILRTLPDDDKADASRGEEDPPMIQKMDRSALISREAASTQVPSGVASSPSVMPSSTPGPLATAPRATRLSGFKLEKRAVNYGTIDQ